MFARDTRRVDHDLMVHCVQGFDHLCVWQFLLERFARESEMDRFLLVSAATGSAAVNDARQVRQAWREYLTLQGGDPAAAGAEAPSLMDP